MVENYYDKNWVKRSHELTDLELLDVKQRESLEAMIASPDKENGELAKELLRLKIADALIKGLNDGQLLAFMEIINFFRDPQHDAVVLKGYAGTGKTFLIKRIIEYITTAYPNRKIAVTAPTNKAVQVLSFNDDSDGKSIVFEDFENPNESIVYGTIHKLLGLKEQIDLNGIQTFTAESKNKKGLNEYKYLIVDEVSMLDDVLFNELIKHKDKIRIIFMGDPAQIPPIGKEHCLPFKEDCPNILKKIELTKIIRQKGSHPIIDYSSIIRKNLTKQQPIQKLVTKLNDEGNGVVYFNKDTNRNMVRKTITKYFSNKKYEDNSDFIKVLAWRNKTVDYVNGLVRSIRFGESLPKFVEGERLIANKTLFKKVIGASPWERQYLVKATTSQEFTVLSVSITTKKFNESVKSSPKVKFEGKFWKLDVKINDLNSPDIVLYVIHKDSAPDFLVKLNKMKKFARDTRSKDAWVMYYNMMKWTDNVSYNYAITVHKSQGSTYDNVILLEEDLDFNRKTIERNRIKYTAYTRAKNRVYILR